MERLMIFILGVTGSNINYHDFTSATLSQFQVSAFIIHDQLQTNTYLSTTDKFVTNLLVDVTCPNLCT